MVLVRKVREKGEIKGNPALEEAREFGQIALMENAIGR